MSNQQHLVSNEDQFRAKKASRLAAAAAPIEEKLLKLLELQKINAELARQSGRDFKEPWQIPSSKK